MTVALSGEEVAAKLEQQFPGSIIESSSNSFLVKGESLVELATYLKTTPELEFDYLNHITAVDYYDYFEVVYQLTSLKVAGGVAMPNLVVLFRSQWVRQVKSNITCCWHGI